MGKGKAGYFLLNAIRGLNILSILAAMLASGALLVKTADLTEDIGWFNVFDLAEKVLIILFSLFLLISEIPRLLDNWFYQNWPAFGPTSGFLALSVALLFLGCDVLSYLVKDKTDEKQLGGDFYRMVQAAGCMCIIMSVINIPAHFLLKDRKSGRNAREVRSEGFAMSQMV